MTYRIAIWRLCFSRESTSGTCGCKGKLLEWLWMCAGFCGAYASVVPEQAAIVQTQCCVPFFAARGTGAQCVRR